MEPSRFSYACPTRRRQSREEGRRHSSFDSVQLAYSYFVSKAIANCCHTKKEYVRGDVHENRAECLFSLLKSYLRVFRGVSKTTLPGYVGFFQYLRNVHQLTAVEQAERILYAALDPAVASRAKKGEFVTCLDHFELLQSPIN